PGKAPHGNLLYRAWMTWSLLGDPNEADGSCGLDVGEKLPHRFDAEHPPGGLCIVRHAPGPCHEWTPVKGKTGGFGTTLFDDTPVFLQRVRKRLRTNGMRVALLHGSAASVYKWVTSWNACGKARAARYFSESTCQPVLSHFPWR